MGISALKVLWTKRQHYSQNENLCEEVVEYKVIVYDSATAACKWANLTENNNNSYIVNWQHSMNLIRYFQNSAVFIHAPILQSRCYVWFSLEWIINWPANQLFSSQCTGECVRKECAIIECTGWKLCCWSWLKSLKRVEHTKIDHDRASLNAEARIRRATCTRSKSRLPNPKKRHLLSHIDVFWCRGKDRWCP